MNLAEMMRPTTLDEVIGNEHIVDPLQKQLDDGTLSQTIMFTGQFGSGKTTFAKILANELKAEVTEIDCGSAGSVENMRKLVDSAIHSSLFADKKVFILDEVHKLSQPGQSALLKTLEDPNDNVHFILITNEPQKVLKTIKSRCVVYETKPASNTDVGEAVRRVKEKFGIEFESNNDFWAVIEQSEGSLRTVYSLLEKLIAAADENGYVPSNTFHAIVGKGGVEAVDENLPKSFVNKDINGALEAIKAAKSETGNAVGTAMGLYNYMKAGWLKGWGQKAHVKAAMADLAVMLSTKNVDWMDLEALVWKHL